jgi:hypothetical protein
MLDLISPICWACFSDGEILAIARSRSSRLFCRIIRNSFQILAISFQGMPKNSLYSSPVLGQTNMATEINADLESSLLAHETVLASVNVRPEDTVVIEPLMEKVRNRAVVFGEVKIHGRRGVATESSRVSFQSMPGANRHQSEKFVENIEETSGEIETDFKERAVGRQKATQKIIVKFKNFLEKHRTTLRVEAVARAEASLEEAEKLMVAGRAELEVGNFSEAFWLFQDAHKTIEKARLISRLEQELKLNLDSLHEKLNETEY